MPIPKTKIKANSLNRLTSNPDRDKTDNEVVRHRIENNVATNPFRIPNLIDAMIKITTSKRTKTKNMSSLK